MGDIIAFLNQVGVAITAITTVTPEVTTLIAEAANVVSTGQPTDVQWAALHAVQDQNTAILNAPMEGE